MMYVDKDGKFVWFIPVIIGAIMGGIAGHQIGEAHDAHGWDMFGYIFGGAVIGGVAGLAGGAAGAAAEMSILAGGGSAMGAAVVGGAVTGTIAGGINGAGMTALAGGDPEDIMKGMFKGALISGISSAAGAAAFQLTNNFLNDGSIYTRFLPKNTLSYMASSTASQMTANVLMGNNPFKGNDFGFNIGLALPLIADGITLKSNLDEKYALRMAKKYNTENPKYEIYKLRSFPFGVDSQMDDAGNLNLEVPVRGFNKQYNKFNYWTDERWSVNVPLIPNYRTLINILINPYPIIIRK